MVIRVCSKTDLIQKKKMRFVHEHHKILIVFDGEGFYAIRDQCPHQGASLFPGKLEGTVIQCKDHGLKIDLKTASVIDDNKADLLHISMEDRKVKTYRVYEKDEAIWIDI